MSPVTSFSTIRSWEGSQHRAFEEISYQLLGKKDLPGEAKPIRTGNPDGGVEWYVDLPSGKQWGWQAKYTLKLESLFKGMTTSVKKIVDERPNLEKLTFVIPMNLSAGNSRGEKKSQRQKYDDKIRSLAKDIPGAANIQFDLIQESDLLDELTKAEHAGKTEFWWDEKTLGPCWFHNHHEKQKEVAGKRYSPALNVELPIMRDFEGLRATKLVDEGFVQAAEGLLQYHQTIQIPAYLPPQLRSKLIRLSTIIESIFPNIEKMTPLGSHINLVQPLRDSLSKSLHEISESLQEIHDFPTTIKRSNENSEHSDDFREVDSLYYSLLRIQSGIRDLLDWFETTFYRAFEQGAFLLEGPAGIGKTHLLMDAVTKSLEDDDFGLVLFGDRFGDSLWESICQQIGLPNLGRNVLLGMLEAAAETRRGRLLIAIDAINETPLQGYWRNNLQELRLYIKDHPRLALAVSCRDTYSDWIAPTEHRSLYVARQHPGFSGAEVEAAKVYFEHFDLEVPRIPLLTPDFSNPMMLRMVCEALQADTSSDLLHGHLGRVEVFEKYLDSKITNVHTMISKTPQSPALSKHTRRELRKALTAITNVVAENDFRGESLVAIANEIDEQTAFNQDQALDLLNQLIFEGVLSEGWSMNGADDELIIRFTFQAFSDFMLIEAKAHQYRDPISDPAFIDWLTRDAVPGVLEVASIFLPEIFGVELLDFVNLTELSREDGSLDYRQRLILDSFLHGLPYRQSTSITSETIRCLNTVIAEGIDPYTFYSTLFMIAPRPGNLLNARGLHQYLSRFPMARRDYDFGIATYGQLDELHSPVSRLAKWASEGPYPQYANEVIELSATALTWLLSSANRPMRDWVTKALVQLLHGHLDVASIIMQRFWKVNDPYVRQRMLLVLYGSVQRCDLIKHRSMASELMNEFARAVKGTPAPEDELQIDTIRSLLMWGISNKLLTHEALEPMIRPFAFPTLGFPLTEESIQARFNVKSITPPEQSYATVFESVLGHGDFSRYVVDSALYQISHVHRNNKSATSDRNDTHRHGIDRHFSSSIAKRWLFQRVVSLGWRPDLFGSNDFWKIRQDPGRSEHKSERWGKKYQWIAFHQMMARLYDNYLTWPEMGDGPPSWEPNRIKAHLRDIDPTLPPISHNEFLDRDDLSSGWETRKPALPNRLGAEIDFSTYDNDIQRFIAPQSGEVSAAGSSLFMDANSRCWIALDANETQVEEVGLEKRSGLTQYVWHNSWFVPLENAKESARTLLMLRRANKIAWALNEEYLDRGAYWRELEYLMPAELDDIECWQEVSLGVRPRVMVVPTNTVYSWEGDALDCSINNSVSAGVPSRFILKHSPPLSADDGAGWRDEGGLVVFQSTRSSPLRLRTGVFWANLKWIQEFLDRTNTALVLSTQTERLSHQLVATSTDSRVITMSTAVLYPDGRFEGVGNIARSPWPWGENTWTEDE